MCMRIKYTRFYDLRREQIGMFVERAGHSVYVKILMISLCAKVT